MTRKKKWNWAAQREKSAFLAMEDGTVLRGYSVGAPVDALGEVVFNTGMTGYQEILSDPSYCGQFVTMTYPEIGNTGTNQYDNESRHPYLSGFIVHELNEAESWRNEQGLADFLLQHNVPAIAGVDTRGLTTRIRTSGTLKACLCVAGDLSPEQGVARAREWEGLDNLDYAEKVTCDQVWNWDPDGSQTCTFGITETLPEPDLRIGVYDFGIKYNILRNLRKAGMSAVVVPATTTAEEMLQLKPDAVFLSNGPGDPAAIDYAIASARALLGKVPIMGICLGHQILSIACGGRTYRLKFGHHGCNHPVQNLETGSIEITSQNHNFAADPDSLKAANVRITHVNLNDNTVEGIAHRTEPMFAVQYHPEAAPGPHDPNYLFQRFRRLIEEA